MNKQDRERRRVIIDQLCAMSRNGWRDAKPIDYEPLERELRELDRKDTAAMKARLKVEQQRHLYVLEQETERSRGEPKKRL